MDMNGVLNAAYDPATGTIRTTAVTTATGLNQPTDENGVWSALLAADGQSIRVVYV